MTTEEAVRIVRESMLPYNKDCSPRAVGEALETVLAALEAAQKRITVLEQIDTQCVLDAEAQRDQAWAERDEARAEVERLRKLNDDQRISDAKTYTAMIKKAEAALAPEVKP